MRYKLKLILSGAMFVGACIPPHSVSADVVLLGLGIIFAVEGWTKLEEPHA